MIFDLNKIVIFAGRFIIKKVSTQGLMRKLLENSQMVSIVHTVLQKSNLGTGNALERVHRVHKPADLWDITFCTR